MHASRPRVLCITPSWLGDAVLALPALARLRDAPVRVELLVRAGTTRVFVDSIGAGTIHETSRSARLQRFVHAWRLRSRGFDAAVVLSPSWSGAALAWSSGAPYRVGERGALRSTLLTQALVGAGRGTHLAVAYQRLVDAALRALDVDTPAADAAPRPPSPLDAAFPIGLHALPSLPVHANEIDAARFLLQRCGIVAPTRPLVFAPGARYGTAKRYPVEHFAVVAARLRARLEAPLVLVGGAEDAPATRALCERLPGSADLAGQTDVGTLLGVLAQARGVVSNDSGVMHLAAAVGASVLGIFGSSNPTWTQPLGTHAAWVSNPVPCAPCYRRTCPIDFPCMQGLDPQVVVDKFITLIGLASDEIAPGSTPL